MRFTEPGTYRLAVRYMPYWEVKRGAVCVRQAGRRHDAARRAALQGGCCSRPRTARARSSARRSATATTAAASSLHGAIAAGHPLTAEAGARVLADGRERGRRLHRGGVHLLGRREPAHRAGRRRVHARPPARDDATRLLDFFVAVPGLGLAPGRGGRPMDEVDVEFTGGGAHAGLPHRRRVDRRARRARRASTPRTARYGKLPVGAS